MLYNGVTGCIAEQMNVVAMKVSATHDANLLSTVCSEWERQKTFLRSIDDVLMYLVRGPQGCRTPIACAIPVNFRVCTQLRYLPHGIQDRNYVQNERKRRIYDVGIIAFRDCVIRHPNVRGRMRQVGAFLLHDVCYIAGPVLQL